MFVQTEWVDLDRLQAIPRVASPSLEEFRQRYLLPNVPVVITGCIDHWPALHRWVNPEYLQESVPDGEVVPVSFSSSPIFPDYSFDPGDEFKQNPVTQMPFSLYVQTTMQHTSSSCSSCSSSCSSSSSSSSCSSSSSSSSCASPSSSSSSSSSSPSSSSSHGNYNDSKSTACSNSSPKPYIYLSGDAAHLYHNGAVVPMFSRLWRDVKLPSFIDPATFLTCGFWLGRKGTTAHMHYDRNKCHNLNAQIKGRKRFVLFPPSQYENLYPLPAAFGMLQNFSQVNVHQPDRSKHPLFFEKALRAGMQVVLEEGELLFIPYCWYHFVVCLAEVNINVNFWWRPSSPAETPDLPKGFPHATQPNKPPTPRPSHRPRGRESFTGQ